jgi:4-hydroxy-3-methylbut-2-en-1-yl diphosphate reductase
VEDVASFAPRDPANVAFVTQTTLSVDDTAEIVAALRARFPGIAAPHKEDICYATTNRQTAVRQIAPECDLVLVVGSKNSSNSVRLTEIAQNVGTPARLLDDVSELDWSWFATGDETVLVTAGASAPEDLVAGLCRALLHRFGGTIETRDVFEEDVEFAQPGALRRIMESRGIDPESRRIRVSAPVVTADLYGAVPLTVRGERRA